MKLQEVFEKAYRAVIAQGMPGFGRDDCAYVSLTPDGKEVRCALGHLVEGEAVHEIMGLNDIVNLLLPEIEPPIDRYTLTQFTWALRHVHDRAAEAAWRLNANNEYAIDNEIFMTLFRTNAAKFATSRDLTLPKDV